jgi:hypothetical protein
VSATFSVDLKLNAAQRQALQTIFNQVAAKATSEKELYGILTVEYGYKSSNDALLSADIFDDAVAIGGAAVSAVDKSKKIFQMGALTWEKARTLFDGYASISFIDNNIPITETTTNTYYAKVYLQFDENVYDQVIYFTPTGVYLDDSDTMRAYDEVTWIVDTDDTDKGYYYSNPTGNYAEIKDQTNPHYDEEYEAMAGVPTTEDLYIGFGGTEFMLNLETELATDKDKTRTYTFTQTFTNVVTSTEI